MSVKLFGHRTGLETGSTDYEAGVLTIQPQRPVSDKTNHLFPAVNLTHSIEYYAR
jgi:hypothetical protein